MPSNEKTAVNFVARKPNPRKNGEVCWDGTGRSTIFCTGNVLSSYGLHWPLAVFVGDKSGVNFFVRNGDYYGSTTRRHLGYVGGHGVNVSRKKLKEVGINFENLKLYQDDALINDADILFLQPESITYVFKRGDKFLTYDDNSTKKVPFNPPAGGMFVKERWDGRNEGHYGRREILGSCPQ